MRQQGHPETEIVPYLRGELAPADRIRLARHLDDCAECRRTALAYQAILEDLGRAIPAPPDVHWGRYRAELRERLAGRRERTVGVGRWLRPVPLALSAAMAGVLVLLAVQGGVHRDRVKTDPAALEDLVLGRRLELLQRYSLLERLDLLEDYDVIQHLDGLAGPREG